jgi:hypothetical protein
LRSSDKLRPFISLTISQFGLVALAEVVGEGEIDARSLARLLWSAPTNRSEQDLFNYFIDRGLRRYEEGLSLDIAKAAQVVAAEAVEAAEREGVRMNGNETEDVARTARFLDRFEDRFYEKWRRVSKD